MSAVALSPPASLPHPAVWRASHLGGSPGPCVDTGYRALSAELPGRGWPRGQLIEFLVARDGVGELRLLQPALGRLARGRTVALVQPPHVPHAAGWADWQLDPARLLWVRPDSARDALWAADQILKNGSCSALLCWLPQARATELRRLHAAAQATDTLFIVVRPMAAAEQASPAPLRLIVRPALGGVLLRIVKRRGPPRDLPLHVAWPGATTTPSSLPHVPLDRHLSSSPEPGRPVRELAGIAG